MCEKLPMEKDGIVRLSKIRVYLSISPRYLANLCKTVSGKGANEWIDEYIMNDVRRYLIGTDLSVKEVASRTLFTNLPFFSKTVKRHFRMTPLELRNRNIMSHEAS